MHDMHFSKILFGCDFRLYVCVVAMGVVASVASVFKRLREAMKWAIPSPLLQRMVRGMMSPIYSAGSASSA